MLRHFCLRNRLKQIRSLRNAASQIYKQSLGCPRILYLNYSSEAAKKTSVVADIAPASPDSPTLDPTYCHYADMPSPLAYIESPATGSEINRSNTVPLVSADLAPGSLKEADMQHM